MKVLVRSGIFKAGVVVGIMCSVFLKLFVLFFFLKLFEGLFIVYCNWSLSVFVLKV